MALSNWLNGDEWCGVFIAGMHGHPDPDHLNPTENLGDQMRCGIAWLARADYTFEGITTDLDGNYVKVKQCSGSVDFVIQLAKGRMENRVIGERALKFFQTQVPKYDCEWLVEALAP